MEFLIFILGILALWLLMPRGRRRTSKSHNRKNLALYATFVALLAFSPIIGGIFASLIGLNVDAITAMCFIWIGVVLSLPTSLLIAKLLGEEAYNDYWAYLESFPHSSKRSVIRIWASASIFAFIPGVVGLFFLS